MPLQGFMLALKGSQFLLQFLGVGSPFGRTRNWGGLGARELQGSLFPIGLPLGGHDFPAPMLGEREIPDWAAWKR